MDPIDPSSSGGISPVSSDVDTSGSQQPPASASPSQPAESTGVDPKAYPDASKIAGANTPDSSKPGIGHNSEPAGVGKINDTSTNKPAPVNTIPQYTTTTSASGAKVQTSSITIPAGTNPVNTRNDPQGAKDDAKMRAGYVQQTGYAPSHIQATQFGAPTNAANINSFNTLQNGPGGNWNKGETRDANLINNNSNVDRTRTVTTVTLAGSNVPLYQKATVTSPDGSVNNNGQNVLYGNFPNDTSRAAAANGGLKPGEARQLDTQQRARIAEQATSPAAQTATDQWNRVQSMSKDDPNYQSERQKLVIQGGKSTSSQPSPDGSTPPAGGAASSVAPKVTEPTAATGPTPANRISDTARNASFNLAGTNLNTAGSYASTTLSAGNGTANGTVSAAGAGYNADASAGAKVQNGALNADAHVGAKVYAGEASVNGNLNLSPDAHAAVNANAIAGADAEAGGQANFDPRHLTANAKVDASAFIGAKAQAGVSGDAGGVGLGAQGTLGVGLGGSVNGNVGVDHGKFSFSLGAQGYLGIGGGFKVSGSVDVPKVASEVYSAGQAAANAVVNAWNHAW